MLKNDNEKDNQISCIGIGRFRMMEAAEVTWKEYREILMKSEICVFHVDKKA